MEASGSWKNQSESTFTCCLCVVDSDNFDKPQFLVFLGVPRGPKNTSHILLTPCALWHPGFNKGIVLDTFCSIDSLSATSLYFNPKKMKDSLAIRSVRFRLSAAHVWWRRSESSQWRASIWGCVNIDLGIQSESIANEKGFFIVLTQK